MLQALLVAARTLIKRPGYVLAVIITLGIGLGASVMMFTLVDAAMLRPLPFERSERLVALTGVFGPDRVPRGASIPEALDWHTMNGTLDDVSLYDETSLTLRAGTEAIRVQAEMVSASYFRLLGASAAMGRTFLPEEDAVPDRNPVVVIGDRLWRERLGGDRGVLNRSIYLNDRQVQVVGVMPPGFSGISFDTEVWFPAMLVSLTSSPDIVRDRGSRWLLVIGRLRNGITVDRAQEDLTRVARVLESEHPATNRQRGVEVVQLREALLGDRGRLILALLGAVLLFLVVACSNVASLQLARAVARRRELAMRVALGARRWHVLRELLAESILMSVAAGILAAFIAAWGIGAAVALMPPGALPQYIQPLGVDLRALLFTLGTAFVISQLVALVPAAAAWRGDLVESLKAGARSAEPGLGSIRRPSTRQALVVAEIAVATILLVSAGLIARSLQRQFEVRLGFDPQRVIIGRLSLPGLRYSPEQRVTFVERLEERLRRSPGVAAVAIGSDLPLTGNTSASVLVPDIATPTDPPVRYYRHAVAPGYFEALGIPLVRGRGFTAQDRRGGPPVVVISESGARRIWGRLDVVGRRVRFGTQRVEADIVGVAADARFRDLTTDLTGSRMEPDLYFPFAQRTDGGLEVAVRSRNGELVRGDAVQRAIADLDASLPFFGVRLLTDAVQQQTSAARFASVLLGIFSGGALLLAALGLYGLIAYVTSLSGREIAIRLALGASARRVISGIVRNGMMLVATGVLFGTGGALAAGRLIQAQLFRTSSVDPVTLTGVAVLLVAVTFGASLLPTRRAVRLNLHSVLQGE